MINIFTDLIWIFIASFAIFSDCLWLQCKEFGYRKSTIFTLVGWIIIGVCFSIMFAIELVGLIL
jgi:predicted membrane channel-forming protein YqfA (hemolysin III family)